MINPGYRISHLTYHGDQQISECSHQKKLWICDCGKETYPVTKNVTKLVTKSCGRCNEISKEEISKMKFGKLRIKEPRNILPGSNKRETWICDCGKEIASIIESVISGNTVSCGRCNEISKEEISKMKFGKLRIKEPRNILPGSNKKQLWVCDCGKEVLISIASVTSSYSKSCGKCNEISKEEISKMKFGKLRIKEPRNILPGSNKYEDWVCDCGGVKRLKIFSVTSGNTKSCGKCYDNSYSWYLKNEKVIKSLKCPISQADLPDGFGLLEVIKTTKSDFSHICQSCKKPHETTWEAVRQGARLTCGCSYNNISGLTSYINNFCDENGIKYENEFVLNGLKYDVILNHSILLELNGLKWHSLSGSKEWDLRKYENATNNYDYEYLMLYEDEVALPKVRKLILNKLNMSEGVKSIRPSKCDIRAVKHKDVSDFYDDNHYIGKVNAKVHYGVFYDNKLISAISFSNPTRQTSKHEWELVRMCSHPEYRVHGIWSKLLKKFINEFKPKSVVSFSDNRLFSGKVYEKIGFKFDGDVKPDYCWTDSYKRFHKSGLRKTVEERKTGLTETQLRESQGYKKIWDLGKKRWVINVIVK